MNGGTEARGHGGTEARGHGGTGARLTTVLMGVLLLAAPVAVRAQYPTSPPAAGALRPVRFPAFVTGRLANGLDYIIVAQHEQPLVSVSLSVPAGARYETAERTGLSGLVADLLTKGTSRRTAEQLAAEVEGAGGSIGAGASEDYLTIYAGSLSENLPGLLDVLADVVTGATFPESEVELTRTRLLSALQIELSQPVAIAQRNFGREVYGEHPYGRNPTPTTLRAVTRDDVVRFHRERVRPAGALLVIAGDVDPVRVRQLAGRAFAAWTGAPVAVVEPPPPPGRARTEVVLVHKPGAVQSNIVTGFTFITPRDPALYPLTVMNRVLGGGADSRLFLILREQHGWTYGAYSGFSRPRGVGAFQATAEVRTEVTDSAVTVMLQQLERIRTEAPPDSEFAAAKNYLVGSFPLSIETPQQIAQSVANARLRGLPDDYVIRYRDRLAAVTAPAMTAAARRYLTTDRMAVVVVGDGQRVLAPLRALGMPVRIVDVEGRPMEEADLTPRASAVRWLPERLTPVSLTYRVMVQGNPFGEATRRIERTSESGREVVVTTGRTVIGPFADISDTVSMDARSLAPIRVRAGGQVQGQAMLTRLDYEGARVRGQVRALTQAGPREAQVDTTLAEGTVDDNQVALLFAALPLTSGARWTIPMFSGDEGRVVQLTVAVTGEETVTVPAGAIPCWTVEVTGGPAPMTFSVMKEAPYALVRYSLPGAPVTFELVNRQ